MVMLAVQASIMITVFSFGLEATIDDVLYVVRRPSRFIRSFVSMFVVMPLLAIALDKAFDFNHATEVALVALALSPVPPLLQKREDKAGARASYALGLMVTMALLSIVIIPAAIELLEQVYDRSFAMPAIAIAKIILLMAIVPLAVGMLVGAIRPTVAAHLAKLAGITGTLLLLVVVILILKASMHSILALIGNGTLFAVVVFVVVGLAAGHWLGGPDPKDRSVLALSTAARHPGIALAMATFNFPNEHAITAAILLYLLINIAISIPYVMWQRRRQG